MPFYRDRSFGFIHMKGRNLPAPCGEQILIEGKLVTCAFPSEYLCDGTRAERSGTCDRPLCPAHITQVGPNRHLCPRCRTQAGEESGQRSLFTQLVGAPNGN